MGLGGLNEIITVIFLFCGAMRMEDCCLLFYIFYSLISFIRYIEPVGKITQNSIMDGIFEADGAFYVCVAWLLFLPFAIYWTFQAYKEFRGCKQDAGG